MSISKKEPSHVWDCPYCSQSHYSEYGLSAHIKTYHREYGIAGRCQAYLLTPSARSWHKYSGQSIRCTHAAKSLIMPFCGNHVKLAEFIVEIVWKEI